ncbi:hypothetical protein X975_20109, partial [Stegodyphus mimosarum]
MVVCNTSIVPLAPASCPVTPTAIHPYPPGLCSLNPVNAITCNQRYPTILSTGPILASTPVPCQPGLSTSPVIRYNQASSSSQSTPSSTDTSPDNSNVFTCNVMAPNNGVLTSNLIPCTTTNIVPLTNGLSPVIPYSPQGPPTATILHCSPKLTCNQGTTTSSMSPVVQCNQGIYTCSPALPTSAVVPCTQRVINGTSVLQCTPGVCQFTPTAVLPTGAVEMCPIPPTPILSSNPAVYPITPPLQIPQNVCAATPASPWKQS